MEISISYLISDVGNRRKVMVTFFLKWRGGRDGNGNHGRNGLDGATLLLGGRAPGQVWLREIDGGEGRLKSRL